MYKGEFLKRAYRCHGNTYTYSKVFSMVSYSEPITITCKVHGDFNQSLLNHLHGAGCPTCGRIHMVEKKRKPFSELLVECGAIHGDSVIIKKQDYQGMGVAMPMKCTKCGNTFQRRPKDLIHYKRGCVECGKLTRKPPSHTYDPNTPTLVYYIRDKVSGYFKIGITTKTVAERFAGMLEDIEIIHETPRIPYISAAKVEQNILHTYKDDRVYNERFAGNGATEFFSNDVLGLAQ